MTNLWIDGMKAPLRHIKGIKSGTHSAPENPESHSTDPKVVKAPSTTWACRILFSSAGVKPEPVAALLPALSAKPNPSYMLSPIHSASLVGSQRIPSGIRTPSM